MSQSHIDTLCKTVQSPTLSQFTPTYPDGALNTDKNCKPVELDRLITL